MIAVALDTWHKEFLDGYELFNGGKVTYGGGAKGQIVGKGTLNFWNFPRLRNVLHVERLNANLISFGQLCDDEIFVKFDQNTCKVFDKANNCVMLGSKSSDNCYQTKNEGMCHVDQTLYWAMIGSLLYVTASRPNIIYSVGVCARYQAKPKEPHLKAVKRIIRYVLGISNLSDVGFSDVGWAGDVDDIKSTTGGCYFFMNNMVSWSGKKHNCVYLSTVESEYVAAGSCCAQMMWIKKMLADYGM